MKNTILLAFFGLFLLASCKKSGVDSGSGSISVIPPSSVPQVVQTTFNTNFAGATEIEWHREGTSSFTSQFNLSSQRHEANFDDNGHQSSHSVICLDAPVPQIVLDAFRQNFPSDDVYEWKLTGTGDWKPHFMRGTVKWEVTISPAGVILKIEHD